MSKPAYRAFLATIFLYPAVLYSMLSPEALPEETGPRPAVLLMQNALKDFTETAFYGPTPRLSSDNVFTVIYKTEQMMATQAPQDGRSEEDIIVATIATVKLPDNAVLTVLLKYATGRGARTLLDPTGRERVTRATRRAFAQQMGRINEFKNLVARIFIKFILGCRIIAQEDFDQKVEVIIFPWDGIKIVYSDPEYSTDDKEV